MPLITQDAALTFTHQSISPRKARHSKQKTAAKKEKREEHEGDQVLADCYYFYNSTCQKGLGCPFRHGVAALGCSIECSEWSKYHTCGRGVECEFRHAKLDKPHAKILCHFESATQEGCRKPHCLFKHLRPRDANGTIADAPRTAKKSTTLSAMKWVSPSLQQEQQALQQHDSVVIPMDGEDKSATTVQPTATTAVILPSVDFQTVAVTECGTTLGLEQRRPVHERVSRRVQGATFRNDLRNRLHRKRLADGNECEEMWQPRGRGVRADRKVTKGMSVKFGDDKNGKAIMLSQGDAAELLDKELSEIVAKRAGSGAKKQKLKRPIAMEVEEEDTTTTATTETTETVKIPTATVKKARLSAEIGDDLATQLRKQGIELKM